MGVADLLVHGALGLWLGSIVFFSLIAAPALFDELGQERAGDAVNVVFPKYYAFGVAMGVVPLAVWTAGPFVVDVPSPHRVAQAGVVIAFVANAYARFSLIPKMEAAGSEAFATYHKQSVGLNVVALVGVAAAFVVGHL
ncbi:DUF4149 domain-containing protein [Halobacterium bonnevillei]|uniref:DUF4149 domain-containing protein n=1 Tax=Halobacterium bonnevillei TaxID=2692200 RepID=A0A6B0SQS2_9EURY|nr:DUF4149 domain-containing protein [Halobacterium bonnevillei]MXR21352.1 DUF4149 domain-containing protein [Halobacterium bonnevillei]